MSRDHFRYLLAAALVALTANAAAAEVTIYRCTDAQGRLALRDTPCRKGERQQTREMLRPTDPAPRPATRTTAPVSPAYPVPPTRVVVVHAPRPLYECVTDDGNRYTSDNPDGNLRWVPLAVLGYPMFPRHDGRFQQGLRGRLEVDGGAVRGRVDFGGPRPRPPPSLHRPPFGAPLLGVDRGYPAGTWVRDACHALPQQEVCGRLRDRRYELDRRYNSALQSERTQITTEQRGIDARLNNDCGVY